MRLKNILMLNDNIPNIGNKLGGGSKGAVHELLNNIYSVVKIGSMNKFERLLYEFLKHYMLYNLSQEQNKQELRNLITKPEKIIIGFNKFSIILLDKYKLVSCVSCPISTGKWVKLL